MPEAIISAKGTEAPTVRSGRFTGTSSLRLFAMHPELKSQYWKRKGERSLWSPSYFAESIGSVNEQAVAKYIDDQRSKERESQ